MVVNKVVMNTENGAETLIDLTEDNVNPATLAKGVQAHDATGAIIVGTATPVELVQELGTSTKAVMSQKAIADEFAKRGQLKPELVNSIEECTDTTKLYVLPDGYIYAYMYTEVEPKPPYENKIPLSINPDGTDYVGLNGEDGYKTGYYIASNGVETEKEGNCMTGYIPVKQGDIVYSKNHTVNKSGYGGIYFYDASFNKLAVRFYENYVDESIPYDTRKDENGVMIFPVPARSPAVAYYRLSTGVIDDTTIITVNEPIIESTGETTFEYAWVNTGHAFVPADYEDRMVVLENKANNNAEEIANLKNNGVSVNDNSLMFISPEGNDNNDGLTANTPKKTVRACVDAGATRISAKRGIYNQYIQLWDVGELEIFPTDNDKIFVAGEDREPIVFEMIDNIELSSIVAYNEIKRVAYSNSENTQFDKVFIRKSLTPVVGDGYGSRYNSTIWLLSNDEKTICIKLKPVLTVSECEAEVNTFTYVSDYIYINANMTGVDKIIVPINWDSGIHIDGANKVVLKEVEVRFSGTYNFNIKNCAYFDFYKCASKYTSYGTGFHPHNANGVMTACYATKNFDGFGISGHGHTTYIDCVSEFNFDDGMSHHDACEGIVIGGRYEGNGKGGNSPAYGAKVNIYGGIYKNNGKWGVGYLYDSGKNASGLIQGVVMTGNPIGLRVDGHCPVTAMACIYKDNTTDKDIKGIFTEY